jgi:predicted hydrocarbon binding protein
MPNGAPLVATLKPAFTFAEALVKRRFSDFLFRPQKGTVVVGAERYVLMRVESLYLSWFEALAPTMGERATIDLIYTVAREMGRSDARAFIDKLRPVHTSTRIASGLAYMAHAGLASVEVFSDSYTADDDTFFLHYSHPNTFETEVLRDRGKKSVRSACFFTGGYFAGWCTEALNMHLHTKEIQCKARGDERCELIMAPRQKLEEHHRRLRPVAPAAPAAPPLPKSPP